MKKMAGYLWVSLLVVMIGGVMQSSAIAAITSVAGNKPDIATKPKTVNLSPPVSPVISLWPTPPTTLKVVLNIQYATPDKDVISGFVVERADNNSMNFAPVAKLGPNERNWGETVTENQQSYLYRVVAVGPTQIRSAPSNYIIYNCLPLPPADLKAQLSKNSEGNPHINLTWTNHSKIAKRVRVYFAASNQNNGENQWLGEIECGSPGSQDSFGTTLGLTDIGSTWTFYVKSWAPDRVSWESNRVSLQIK